MNRSLLALLATLATAWPLALHAADSDGDGVDDDMDNCLNVQNASPLDCDDDQDGYGNACDGDFDQSFTVNANDWKFFMFPDSTTSTNSGTGTDTDCNGTLTTTDALPWPPLFQAGVPGPSGLGCAGIQGCTP